MPGLGGVEAQDVVVPELAEDGAEGRADSFEGGQRFDSAAALLHGALEQPELPAVIVAVAPRRGQRGHGR